MRTSTGCSCPRAAREFGEDLDADDGLHEPGKHRRLVAGAGPDLEDHVVRLGLEQLGNGPSEHAVAPLLELLNDSDSAVVRSAIRSLARLDDPRVRPALERLKEHDTPEVRRVAMAALSKLR